MELAAVAAHQRGEGGALHPRVPDQVFQLGPSGWQLDQARAFENAKLREKGHHLAAHAGELDAL